MLQTPQQLAALLTRLLRSTAKPPNLVSLSPTNVAVRAPSSNAAPKISVCLPTRGSTVSSRLIALALESSPTSVQTTALANDPLLTVLVREFAHSDTRLALTTAACPVLTRLPVARGYQPVLSKE